MSLQKIKTQLEAAAMRFAQTHSVNFADARAAMEQGAQVALTQCHREIADVREDIVTQRHRSNQPD